jgi:hypothetical protein
MPKQKGKSLCLISSSYEGKLRNERCVCKDLPIFVVRETLLNGIVLHTSNMPDQSGQLLETTRLSRGFDREEHYYNER